MPLFPNDRMSNINLNITKTYKEIDHKMFFDHIDFTYQFDYKSRVGEAFEADYTILTNAVLHVYDTKNTFVLPKLDFDKNCVRDYDRINAMPYNDFFWQHNTEFGIVDHDNSNSLFYKENVAYSNSKWYLDNPSFKKVYECPFVNWSEHRIVIKDVSSDTLEKSPNNVPTGQIILQYNLPLVRERVPIRRKKAAGME